MCARNQASEDPLQGQETKDISQEEDDEDNKKGENGERRRGGRGPLYNLQNYLLSLCLNLIKG